MKGVIRMTYSPVELRHVSLQRRLFGYHRGAVDALLDDVADSYEVVWRERADLADRIEQLEGELVRHKDLEHLLRQTLVSAEQAAQHVADKGRADAEAIIEEARAEARDITRRARAEREALVLDARRIRLLLHAALDAAEEVPIDELEEDLPVVGRRGGCLDGVATYTGCEMGEPSTRLDSYRQRLLEERERVVAALDYLHEENAESLGEESEEATFADNIGETATVTLDREIDYSLEEASNHVLGCDRRRSRAHRRRHVRHLHDLRAADRRRAPRGDPVRDAVHRLPPQGGARLTLEPDAPAGVPAGEEARRDGLAAVSVAERSLSAEAAQWLSLALVTVAAVVADQVTKHIVSSQLALDEEVAVDRPLLDPPRPELGHRLRPVPQRDRRR